MCAVKEEENRAGRTAVPSRRRAAVYCLGETGAKVMDRAVLERDHLPNDLAEWFCIRGGGFFDIWDGLSKNDEWFCIRSGPFDEKLAEMTKRALEGKEYLLLLFDLRSGYEDMRYGGSSLSTEQIAGLIVSLARKQGLKVFCAVTTGGIMGGGVSRQLLYEGLRCIGESADCILTLPCTAGQRPEELLWQASRLLLSTTTPQYISLDPADVRELFPNGGTAWLGTGQANSAQLADAVTDLLSSREFTEQLKQAAGLLIHISCPEAAAYPQSIEQAVRPLLAAAPPDADILWSVRLEEGPQTGTRIIVLAADRLNRRFKQHSNEKEKIDNRCPEHLCPDRMRRKKVTRSLWQRIEKALCDRYGRAPDAAVDRRMREEWAAMERCKDIETVAALYEFAQWLKREQAPYWTAGTAGSSLILYLLGVTSGNPLPPHYMCPCCRHILWRPGAADGFDLPAAIRESDGALLRRDGHDLPWQVHWGVEGWDGEPHYCLHLPKALKEQVQAFWADHWLGRLQPAAASVSMRQDGSGCDSLQFSRFCFVFDLDPDGMRPDAARTAPGAAVHRKTVLFSERLAQFGMQPFAEAPCGPEPENTGDAERFIFRDDVFLYLQGQGFSEKDAWRGMRSAMMGEKLPSDIAETAPSLDRQTLAQMGKPRYLFPKAHAVEYLLFCQRAGKERVKQR